MLNKLLNHSAKSHQLGGVAFQISIAVKKETVRSSWPSHALQKVPVESKLQPFLPELATETIHQTTLSHNILKSMLTSGKPLKKKHTLTKHFR